jgi:hypothetical protein
MVLMNKFGMTNVTSNITKLRRLLRATDRLLGLMRFCNRIKIKKVRHYKFYLCFKNNSL